MSEHKCQNTKQGLYLVLEAEQEASYPDSGPVMDSKDGDLRLNPQILNWKDLGEYLNDTCIDKGTVAMSMEGGVGPLHVDGV